VFANNDAGTETNKSGKYAGPTYRRPHLGGITTFSLLIYSLNSFSMQSLND
jgi:hypothetical protein